MNISGPTTPLAAAYGLAPTARPAAPKPVAPTAPTTAAAATTRAEAPEMPQGADPALWSVLTGAEKQFFSQQAAMGPLTYGPGARTTASAPQAMQAPRGQRLDVSA
jgi:hypothetical protein